MNYKETFKEYYDKYRHEFGIMLSSNSHTWDHQQKKIDALLKENQKLKECVEHYERARQCLKELGNE
jgi:hypothetical protein